MVSAIVLSVLLYLSGFKSSQSQVVNLDNTEGESIQNFHKCSEGKSFSKLGTLLSNETTGSVKECCFKCVQNKACLSLNAIALQSQYQCELLNWSGTGFDEYTIPKGSSTYWQAQTVCFPANPCQNGGQCTVKDGGASYTCTCVHENTYGKNCGLKKCVLFDFESGRLHNWTLHGTAFNNQPTYGDNSLARKNSSSNLKGDWYIATFENRSDPNYPVGLQGNHHTGTATSPQFVIRGTEMRFLIGGGSNITTNRLELLFNGSVFAKATSPKKSDGMSQKEFDVSSIRGQVAQIRIVDESSVSWGITNVDHIEFLNC